jgi:hypothetical protein
MLSDKRNGSNGAPVVGTVMCGLQNPQKAIRLHELAPVYGNGSGRANELDAALPK